MGTKSVIFLLLIACLQLFAGTSAMENLLSNDMFDFTFFLTNEAQRKDFDKDIGGIQTAAVIIGGLLWVLQLAKEVYGGLLGDSGWKQKFFYSALKVGIIVIIIKTSAYAVLMQSVIGGIPQTIAKGFAGEYMGKFWSSQSAMFDAYATTKGEPGHFLAVKILNGGISQILAGIAYAIMSAITLIMPMLQKSLFEMCCYIGPFAFAFLLCDWTKGIFDRWLSAALAISWLSVIQAIIMRIFVNDIVGSMTNAAIGNDVISVLITCLMSIAMLISSPAIAMYLFNAGGLGIDKASGAAQLGALALPAVGAGVGKLKSAGYNEDGTEKAGRGAAFARTAYTVGNMAVKGNAGQDFSGRLSTHLAEGKNVVSPTSGADSGGGNSKLGGVSSVPKVGNVDNSTRASAGTNASTNAGTSTNTNTNTKQSGTSSSATASGSVAMGGDSKLGKQSSVPGTGKQEGATYTRENKTTSARADSTLSGSKASDSYKKNPFTQNSKGREESSVPKGEKIQQTSIRAGIGTHKTEIETGNAASEGSQSSIPQGDKEDKKDNSKGESK